MTQCSLQGQSNPEKTLDNLKHEIEIHKSLNHRSIVKLYGYFIESNHINIVLDYLPNGNLFALVRYKRDTPRSQVRTL